MNAIDEIHLALSNMTTRVCSLAPRLRPVVFPSVLKIASVDDLCVTKSQRERVQDWIDKKDVNDGVVTFITSIDYPQRRIVITGVKVVDSTDARLYCLEKVMESLVSGSESDLQVSVDRFLLKNGYDTTEYAEHRPVFNEVYNTSYAMKILVSNVGGFTVYLGDKQLPLKAEDDLVGILEGLYTTDVEGVEVTNGNNGGDDSDDSSELEVQKKSKKRKHKRGKKK